MPGHVNTMHPDDLVTDQLTFYRYCKHVVDMVGNTCNKYPPEILLVEYYLNQPQINKVNISKEIYR